MSALPEDDGGGSWRETHRGLSAVDLRFREVAQASPEFLDRRQFAVLDSRSEILRYRPQSWPTFLGAEKLAELKRAAVAVNRLLRTVPERVFRNDPARLAAFYGLDPRIAGVLFLPPTGADTLMSRGDFIQTAGGFRCIEYNFAAHLGGWDTTVITGLQLAAPPVARFLADEGIRVTFTDTMVEIFRHVLEDLRRKRILRGGEVTVAFVVEPEQLANLGRIVGYLNGELRRTLEVMGLALDGRVAACTYEQVAASGGDALLDGRRVDALVEISGPPVPSRLYLLFRGGRVGLHNTPVSPVLDNKRTLALLSQHAGAGAYSAEEQAVIEAHVPWTRLVAPGPVEYQGETHRLADLLLAHPERFVLKDAASWAGKGVCIGRSVAPEQWRATVAEALAGGQWIAQELQESLPYLYQSGPYGCAVHDVIWGPFVFGDRYGGTVLRMQPKGMAGPVNAALSASEGIVFEV